MSALSTTGPSVVKNSFPGRLNGNCHVYLGVLRHLNMSAIFRLPVHDEAGSSDHTCAHFKSAFDGDPSIRVYIDERDKFILTIEACSLHPFSF